MLRRHWQEIQNQIKYFNSHIQGMTDQEEEIIMATVKPMPKVSLTPRKHFKEYKERQSRKMLSLDNALSLYEEGLEEIVKYAELGLMHVGEEFVMLWVNAKEGAIRIVLHTSDDPVLHAKTDKEIAEVVKRLKEAI